MDKTFLRPHTILKQALVLLRRYNRPRGIYKACLPRNHWLELSLDEFSSDILLPRLKLSSERSFNGEVAMKQCDTYDGISGSITVSKDLMYINVEVAH
jgi:hypothetical protein